MLAKIITYGRWVALAAVICYIGLSLFVLRGYRSDNARLRANQELLMAERDFAYEENRRFTVRDSLHALRVAELRLTVAELKKYRADDRRLISELGIRNKELQGLVTSNMEAVNELRMRLEAVYDSVTADSIFCFNHNSRWIDASGCIAGDTVALSVRTRESIKVVEHIKFKRFLGFLWRTRKIKSSTVDVVSENPNTSVVSVEAVRVVD